MTRSFELEFPTIKGYARINSLDKLQEPTSFFDCKFYPYTNPGVDPVFAVVGEGETVVCRKLPESGVEILRWFHDDDKEVSLNSCAWSQDLASGDPLLCVSGSPSSIKVLNVKTGQLIRTLIGHGKEVNDLAVSPLSPTILASASMDHSVRLWSLDPQHKKQPCMLICAGEGHKEGLLTLSFHHTGKFLLTGAMDCVVILWVIPELPDENSGIDKPTIIHYPHFSTSAIHTDFVDCVAWYNDLVLSKCAGENKIVLWRIEGFDSSKPFPPAPSSSPTPEFRATRSAFGGTFQRLLQFDAIETNPFYMRFSLFTQPHRHPILVIGNEKSKVFWWDLQSIEAWDGQNATPNNDTFKFPGTSSSSKPKKGVARQLSKQQRESSISSSTTAATNSAFGHSIAGASTASFEDRGDRGAPKAEKKFSTDDPFRKLLPHRTQVVPRVTFAARQIAWSVGGDWMVVCGDQGMIAVFGR